jgi:hypothetical protein
MESLVSQKLIDFRLNKIIFNNLFNTEEPLVQCGVDSLSMEVFASRKFPKTSFLAQIRTKRPFSGRLFVKGFSQEQQCQMFGNGSQTQFQFAVHFGQCGLRRSREINGVSVQATVVVSFHPVRFIGGNDLILIDFHNKIGPCLSAKLFLYGGTQSRFPTIGSWAIDHHRKHQSAGNNATMQANKFIYIFLLKFQ